MLLGVTVEEAEEHHHWKKEGLRGKREFRKERKDKGYMMFEEEDSEEELVAGEAARWVRPSCCCSALIEPKIGQQILDERLLCPCIS